MTIPTASNFPNEFDTEDNLFVVHDSLRLRLAEDYNPGDTSITVEENDAVMSKFPATGLITLTEQCSEISERAISLYYSSKTATQFLGLEILNGFKDTVKPKRITNVLQNVMASHHNNLKDALIAIETFIGVQGTIDSAPLGDTLTGRINFLRKLVLTPKAWFTADKTIGLVPLTVNFTDQSFRIGDGDVTFIWNFGDDSTSNISTVSTIQVSTISTISSVEVVIDQLNGGTIEKVYTQPGNYTVSLTVQNEFGEDTVVFEQMINARVSAPIEAQIRFDPQPEQIATAGDTTPTFDRLATFPGGPYTTPPTIRSSINTFIEIDIPSGRRSVESDYSFGGEKLTDSDTPIDPIQNYTWELTDDLTHSNSNITKASYSIGGIYDLQLRVDTEFGSYRITNYPNVIDIIESRNLWLYTETSEIAKGHEFGLISETFKTATRTLTLNRNDSFLSHIGIQALDSTYPAEIRAKREFAKNTGFGGIGPVASGDHGTALIAYASGSASGLASQEVIFNEYEGFGDTYTTPPITITRPWNWVMLNSGTKAYFIFGPDPAAVPFTNSSYQLKSTLDYSPSYTVSNSTLDSSSYKNSAQELQEHVTSGYLNSGEPVDGRFATYRSTWKDQTGFIIRNDGVGTFFRLKSFYKTEGILSEPFLTLKKLTDLAGGTKLEGELVTLTSGIYFFSNNGNISAYNDTTNVWITGGPSSSSASFRSLQDSTANGFDSPANTLLATSDGDQVAYLSFDYSTSAFIKFSATDTTFSKLTSRPVGDQWVMGVY